MSADFITRILGMIFFSLMGAYYGGTIGALADAQADLYAIIFGLLGALLGLIITPMITIRPIKAIRNRLTQVSSRKLVAGQIGLVSGLIGFSTSRIGVVGRTLHNCFTNGATRCRTMSVVMLGRHSST